MEEEGEFVRSLQRCDWRLKPYKIIMSSATCAVFCTLHSAAVISTEHSSKY